MTDKDFVISIEPSAFSSRSSISGSQVIYEDDLRYVKMSEYWPLEDDAWKDAAERLRKRFLLKLES